MGMAEGDTRRPDSDGDDRACQRIETLVDAGSFVATGESGEAGAAGFARIDGRRVCVHADGGPRLAGRTTAGAARRLHALLTAAGRGGTPSIMLLDGSGPRLDEGGDGLAAWAEVLAATARLEGRCLRLAVLCGPIGGAGGLLPGLADLVVSVPGASVHCRDEGAGTSHAPIPGADRTAARRGGSSFPPLALTAEPERSSGSGLELAARDETQAFAWLRSALALLARPAEADPAPAMKLPGEPARSALAAATIPEDPNTPWDVRHLVRDLVDEGALLALGDGHDPLFCALARLEGRAIGVLANRAEVRAGVPDLVQLRRAARFVRLCDQFDLAMISLIDAPALADENPLAGAGSVAAAASELVAALARARVPRLAILLRKGFGAVLLAMAGLPALADRILALPGTQLAATLPDQALEWLHGHAIESADDPLARRDALADEYRLQETAAERAAERGLVDTIVPLDGLRQALRDGLAMLDRQRRRDSD